MSSYRPVATNRAPIILRDAGVISVPTQNTNGLGTGISSTDRVFTSASLLIQPASSSIEAYIDWQHALLGTRNAVCFGAFIRPWTYFDVPPILEFSGTLQLHATSDNVNGAVSPIMGYAGTSNPGVSGTLRDCIRLPGLARCNEADTAPFELNFNDRIVFAEIMTASALAVNPLFVGFEIHHTSEAASGVYYLSGNFRARYYTEDHTVFSPAR